MDTRILHVSDLHLGRRDVPEPGAALRALARELAPELVLATGDLAHRGRRAQLEHAAGFLRGLGPPVLAVPGNHDIPYTFPDRFTRSFDEWERVLGTPSPVYRSEGVVVVGVNSVRPWRHQSGAVRDGDLERIATELAGARDSALRIVALHHHLANPPWRSRKQPVVRRSKLLRALASAGAELVAAGHVHQAGITERREFEVVDEARARTLVLATVPGFGRPRPRRRGEAVGFNVYEADRRTLTVRTYAWSGSAFDEVATRTFTRD